LFVIILVLIVFLDELLHPDESVVDTFRGDCSVDSIRRVWLSNSSGRGCVQNPGEGGTAKRRT
jgi:hypothetical protein